VSILFRKQLPGEILNIHRSKDGRRLLVNTRFEENVFTLVNIYARNQIKERCDFLKRISTWCNQYTINKENFVIGGDFNCDLDNQNNTDKSVNTLRQFNDDFELIDIWISLYNNDKELFTWCTGENIPTSRIDYIFISSNLCFKPNNLTVRSSWLSLKWC
jgi:exonuclease III